jgi:[ribosomal protein S5]-alanine N-acetyltransferase
MSGQTLVHKSRESRKEAAVAPENSIAGAVVCGSRIHLREVRLSDVNERYYRWMNDPEVNRYLETRFVPQSLESIGEFVRHMTGKSDEPFFAICTNEGSEHIGNIKIGPINFRHRSADISLLIGEKSFWGKGYASEAISLVTKFGFEVINLNKLEAGCYEENEGSARAFEKCGYIREGLLRGHLLLNGRETNCVRLGLRASDYFARQQS